MEKRPQARAILLLVMAILSSTLAGCQFNQPTYLPGATVAYVLWVDLTENNTIVNGEVTSATPELAKQAAMQILDVHSKERGVKVLLRGITNKSFSEDFVYDYTFQDSASSEAGFSELNDANLADIPTRVSTWIKQYHEEHRSGIDLPGAIDKTATLSKGYPNDFKVGAIVVSTLRHATFPDTTPIPFNRKSRFFCVAVNEEGASARSQLENRVKLAKGTMVKYQTPKELYNALVAFGKE